MSQLVVASGVVWVADAVVKVVVGDGEPPKVTGCDGISVPQSFFVMRVKPVGTVLPSWHQLVRLWSQSVPQARMVMVGPHWQKQLVVGR
jgi:hypothetical protein